jgi:hypothetical protein
MTLKVPETVMIRAQRRGSWAQGLTSRITGPQADRAKPRTGISDRMEIGRVQAFGRVRPKLSENG